jgi:hypothetical protein
MEKCCKCKKKFPVASPPYKEYETFICTSCYEKDMAKKGKRKCFLCGSKAFHQILSMDTFICESCYDEVCKDQELMEELG